MIELADIIIAIYLGVGSFLNIIVPLSGSATVTSVLALLTDPQKAIAIAAWFFALNGLIRIYFFRREIQWVEIKRLLPFTLLAAAMGIYLTLVVDPIMLYVVILLFATYFLIKKLIGMFSLAKKKENKESHYLLAPVVALVSGFFQGSGFGGSEIRNAYLFARNLTIPQLHGTTALIGVSTFLLSGVVRLYEHSISFTDLGIVLSLFPVIIIATLFGKKILHKLNEKTSDYIIVAVMSFVVMGMVWKLMVLM